MPPQEYFNPDNMTQVDDYCKGCKHLAVISAGQWCDYIGSTRHCRPCPAGKGCTVKEKVRRSRTAVAFSDK